MADKRISQLVERTDIANNDVVPIVASGATTTNKATISSIQEFMQENLDLGVTSVGITLGTTGTDVSVTGSPITTSGNITINLPTASATNRGLLSSADWTTFNNKQAAGNYVTLDTAQTITAQKTFSTSGGSDTAIINHGSGSGIALNITKAGNGEGLRVAKTSGTGNAVTITGGLLSAGAATFGGNILSNEFLYVREQNASTLLANYTQIYANSTFFGFTNGAGTGSAVFTYNGSRNYTLPSASGTLALTSNLESYVPYTGATGAVDLGTHSLSSNNLIANGGLNAGALLLKNANAASTINTGYLTLSPSSTTTRVTFGFSTGASTWKSLSFSSHLLTDNTPTIFSFPNGGGTLAVTTDLSAYLPLTGGTLTGALNGTSASFGGSITTTITGGGIYYAFDEAGRGVKLSAPGSTYGFVGKVGSQTNHDFRVETGDAFNTLTFGNKSGSTWLTLASTGAATFSSSVTAGGNISIPSTSQVRFNGPLDGAQSIRYNSTLDGLQLQGFAGLAFLTGSGSGTERMRLDSSGNLGLGVTPSAWDGRSMQIVNSSLTDVASSLQLTYNAYFDGSNWRYLNSASASNYFQAAGIHAWRTAPSGTAGNAISFTQAMTLDASGNLALGTTSANARLEVRDGAIRTSFTSGNAFLELYSGSNAGYIEQKNDNPLITFVNGAERMRITSGGNVLIGQTTASGVTNGIYLRKGIESGFIVTDDVAIQLSRYGSNGDIQTFFRDNTKVGSISVTTVATTYNVTSDYRLKEDLKEIKGLEKVKAIKVYDYKWKSEDSRMDGVLAHELAEVLPYAVTGEKDEVDEEGNDMMQGVDYSKIVPILIKAIQEQQEQIDSLKNQIK